MAALEIITGGAGVIPIMTLAGDYENGIAGARQTAGAAGDALADTADNLGLGLTGCPRGRLPCTHGRNWNHGYWHGGKSDKIRPPAKAQTRAASRPTLLGWNFLFAAAWITN